MNFDQPIQILHIFTLLHLFRLLSMVKDIRQKRRTDEFIS